MPVTRVTPTRRDAHGRFSSTGLLTVTPRGKGLIARWKRASPQMRKWTADAIRAGREEERFYRDAARAAGKPHIPYPGAFRGRHDAEWVSSRANGRIFALSQAGIHFGKNPIIQRDRRSKG